ncbi:MAG: outer membrane lipoprotein chaperone LolA [Betaproteobacteria bacterium]|jgi:outer membrane lipoprotein carrier protein|nr:outer membrane lipoprotein chaperone LolA [Betaproteobacteria bacterium]MDH5287098.1 outer membrane lipoprotein chaperone LolA [Betaproteobacteria bacterium]
MPAFHLALASLLAAFPLAAASASLDALRSFLRDTREARVAFTQTVTDKAGRKGQPSRGELALSRPGKFRWSVEKPYRQLVVGDGERVWIFDEDLNQVVVRRMGAALGSTPAALLAGREDVEKAFRWRELGSADGLDWLEAVPTASDAAFTQIRLGFAGRELAALALTDTFGQTTRVDFGAMQRNPPLPPDTFRFVPPKGADVIGER